jgi:hypothetical protein
MTALERVHDRHRNQARDARAGSPAEIETCSIHPLLRFKIQPGLIRRHANLPALPELKPLAGNRPARHGVLPDALEQI